MLNSVSVQIQTAISDAINKQVLPQIQNALEAGSGQTTQKGWNVPAERPEYIFKDSCDERIRSNSRGKFGGNRLQNDITDQDYDMVTGDNEPPIQVPEFLTGRMPSQSHLNKSHDDLNPLLDTTIPAQENTAPAIDLDQNNRLADVLISMQNRPTAQQLTIRPFNSNTITFDGRSETFELFGDLFHTMIKMQPEISEQMKINHFNLHLKKNALQAFRNISTANRQTLEDVLVFFRRKYVKPESQATAKPKEHRLVFDPNTMKLPDFLGELNQGAEKAFGDHSEND